VEPAAGSAVDAIVSETAAHGVEAGVAGQIVVTVTAADHIGAGAAVDRVVSLQTVDDVATRRAGERVVSGSSDDRWRCAEAVVRSRLLSGCARNASGEQHERYERTKESKHLSPECPAAGRSNLSDRGAALGTLAARGHRPRGRAR